MAISLIETASLDTGLVAPSATALTTASGSAPSYSARAWVDFNGTGTVAIRASGNVSSITDNGTGDYTVNFTTAMPDANYSVVAGGYHVSGSYLSWGCTYGTQTTTTCPIRMMQDNGNVIDSAVCTFSIFR
jgi:hypothetical protein